MSQGQSLPGSFSAPPPLMPQPGQPGQPAPLPQQPVQQYPNAAPTFQYGNPGEPLPPAPQLQQPVPQWQQPPQSQQWQQPPAPQPLVTYPGQQPPQPLAQPSSIRASLTSRGIDVSGYDTDDAILADLGRSAAERQRMEQLARIGQQALERQQQQQFSPPPAPSAVPTPTPAEPEWRPEWGALLQRDPDTGLFTPKPGNEFVAGQIAHIANRQEAERRERAEQLMKDPLAYLQQHGLEEILAKHREATIAEIRQQEQDRQTFQQVQQWQTEVGPLLYQVDQSGRNVLNPLTGQPVLTPLGQRVSAHRHRFSSWFQGVYGVEPDDALIMQAVSPIVDAHRQQQEQSSPNGQPLAGAYDPAQNEAMKQRMTVAAAAQQAMYTPNQNGTVAAAAMNAALPQNSQANLAQAFHDEAVRLGIMHPQQRW